jgi:hypothetical protein
MRSEDIGVSAPQPARRSSVLRYLDLIVVVVAAPIAVLAGVPSVGYAIGAAAWVLLRGLALAVEQRASNMDHVVEQVALRLSYRLARAALLTGAAVVAFKAYGRGDGLTALAVIVTAFTIRLPLSLVDAHTASFDRVLRRT